MTVSIVKKFPHFHVDLQISSSMWVHTVSTHILPFTSASHILESVMHDVLDLQAPCPVIF